MVQLKKKINKKKIKIVIWVFFESVLLSASVKRFSVSRMRNFKLGNTIQEEKCLICTISPPSYLDHILYLQQWVSLPPLLKEGHKVRVWLNNLDFGLPLPVPEGQDYVMNS